MVLYVWGLRLVGSATSCSVTLRRGSYRRHEYVTFCTTPFFDALGKDMYVSNGSNYENSQSHQIHHERANNKVK